MRFGITLVVGITSVIAITLYIALPRAMSLNMSSANFVMALFIWAFAWSGIVCRLAFLAMEMDFKK